MQKTAVQPSTEEENLTAVQTPHFSDSLQKAIQVRNPGTETGTGTVVRSNNPSESIDVQTDIINPAKVSETANPKRLGEYWLQLSRSIIELGLCPPQRIYSESGFQGTIETLLCIDTDRIHFYLTEDTGEKYSVLIDTSTGIVKWNKVIRCDKSEAVSIPPIHIEDILHAVALTALHKEEPLREVRNEIKGILYK